MVAAEIVFSVETELAQTLTDVMARRTLLAFEPDHGLAAVEDIAAVLARQLNWDEPASLTELADTVPGWII